MKKSFSKILSVLLVLIMAVSVIPMSTFNASAATSGTCGENLTWSYDESTCELTISGTGAMTEYDYSSDIPWHDYKDSIKSVIISDGVTTIVNYSFYDCKNLSSITLPESITTIGNDAFCLCKSLSEITIPDSVTTIGNYAFSYCDNLTTVTVGDGSTTIGDHAFYNCDSLTTVTVGDGLTTIGDNAFYDCDSLTTVTVGDSLSTIGNRAFSSCNNLKTVTVGDGLSTIGDYAFYTCDNLTTVTLGDGLTTIGNHAFAYCIKLSDFAFSDSLTTIGDYAFYNCEVKEFNIPKNVKSIGLMAFCLSRSKINVDSENPYFCSENGMMYNKDKTALIYCPTPIYYKTISIPEGVTTIRSGAFAGSKLNSNLIIPDTVTVIEDSAFVYVPNSNYLIATNSYNIYYTGSEEQWNKISIGNYNQELKRQKIFFNYCDHAYELTETVEPTCNESGYTAYTCTKCGNVEKRDLVDATGHRHTAEITTPATHLTTGIMTFTCTCGDTYTEVIEKIATHNHISVVTAPTCTEKGFTTYTCECGDSYVADYVDATGHIDEDGNNICDNCGITICNHMCHKSGIHSVAWSLIRIILQLFGIERFCECGAAHY